MTIGAVGGFVALAHRQAAEPTIKPALLKLRLSRLAKMPVKNLTLDQAEDGMVLSRKFNEPDLEREFAKVATMLKSRRSKR